MRGGGLPGKNRVEVDIYQKQHARQAICLEADEGSSQCSAKIRGFRLLKYRGNRIVEEVSCYLSDPVAELQLGDTH